MAGIELSSQVHHTQRAPFYFSQNSIDLTGKELTPEEQKLVEELKKRDASVRRHERAHKSAAGPHARGTPRYEYVTGPDGKRYAVSGEISLDTSEIKGNPKATLRKAQRIKKAALAPAQPSTKDRQIAAQASRIEAKARKQLEEMKRKELKLYDPNGRDSQKLPGSVFLDFFS